MRLPALALLLALQPALAQQPAERAAAEAAARRAETVRQPIAPSVQYPFATPPLRQQAEDLERAGRNAEAIKTYIRAARSGDGKAAMRLGQIYRDGIDGVAPNRDESRKWFNAARVLGEYRQPPEPLQKPR